ncbi:MAG: GspE/PulE family protein [Candidatus Omnitrophota bacterium]
MTDKELENLLLRTNLLSQEEISRAVEEMKKLKRPVEKVILEVCLLSRPVLYEAIAKHLGYSYVKLEEVQPDPELIKVMPEALARQTQSVPIKIENNTLHVAVTDPTDLYSIDQIQMHTGMALEVSLSSPQEIDDSQNKLYVEHKVTKDFMEDLTRAVSSDVKTVFTDVNSIIKLVDLIVSQAVHDRASDIHVEPEQETTRIRFRIDGILHEIPSPPKEWESAIISRIKVLASMDIAESRVPQDGHFQAKIEDRIIDFRISTVPTIYGENVVMRLLDTNSVTIGLEKLGFTTYDELKRYEGLISKPYGIILSTGPTGSGKTTTLYSALMRINTIDRNIITIEDPVEYRLGLIRQIQVNPKAGITFANGLRAILRQDPDVLMVGEIRDLETAIIAVQAALTGHLVFSTLHTNDAPSAITRLVNMGVEPFLISACLIGVMAQRLIRIICDKCKESYEPSKSLMERWGLSDKKGVVLYRGRGCEACKGTGFKGRSGLFELMTVDDEIREMIISESSTVSLRNKSREKGMRVLSEDGIAKALAGITTIEEVARVCEERVEIKKTEESVVVVEPFIKPAPSAQKSEAKPVEVKATDYEEYQKRIANWLSNK